MCSKLTEIKIRQASAKGWIACENGGVADLSYPSSKTRRGRVVERGRVCPTMQANYIPDKLDWKWDIDGEEYQIKIRKLTPRECWRLMGFSDEDFEKAEAVNSNTQLYAQAGNSIVKDVLMQIFAQLLEV